MPAFHEALIGGVRITYTIERDGTLLLALSDLAPSDPAAARALLARVAEAVGRRVRTLLADAPDAPWILEDGEVWELQRWEPFVGWGSTFPGHLYPTDPARWCQRWCQRWMLMQEWRVGWATRGARSNERRFERFARGWCD